MVSYRATAVVDDLWRATGVGVGVTAYCETGEPHEKVSLEKAKSTIDEKGDKMARGNPMDWQPCRLLVRLTLLLDFARGRHSH